MTCTPSHSRNGATGANVERYRRAIELRDAGAKLREIGVELGVSVERARQMVSPYRRAMVLGQEDPRPSARERARLRREALEQKLDAEDLQMQFDACLKDVAAGHFAAARGELAGALFVLNGIEKRRASAPSPLAEHARRQPGRSLG